MKLFKYYPDNIYSFKSLAVRGLWCHYPKNMNDPFECLGFIDRDISVEKIHSIKQQFEGSNNPLVKKILNFSDNKFKQFVKESRNRIISQYAFCSLSRTCDNILMWSHYASSHSGFVLEFDFDKTLRNQISKVKYKDELPEFDFSNVIELIAGKSKNQESILNDISIKSTDWRYEKEFRIWRRNAGYFFYPKESLKRIIFGINCSAETKKIVIELMGEFEDTIQWSELEINKNPLELNEIKTYR